MKLFAAIDVGSYELTMKIFEISGKGVIRQIDYLKKRIELGTDTYNTGFINAERVDELCNTLQDFKNIAEGYMVDNIKAYATSAIRETRNTLIILEQIKLRTGLTVEVLSNSEARFLHYMGVASKGKVFDEMIQKGTIIADIGGGSIQFSVFSEGALTTTQNIRLGILRMREMLADLAPKTSNYAALVEELIDNHFYTFNDLYLKNTTINNIIIVDDYVSNIIQKAFNSETITAGEYKDFMYGLKGMKPAGTAKKYGLSGEYASLFVQSAILLRKIIQMTKAEVIWAPGVGLSDGMVYQYVEKEKLGKRMHNFDDDIIMCAKSLARRYKSNESRCALLERIAVKFFDSTKKIHGMGKRERLLLRIATILSDCGKYMSLEDAAECSYVIIMATEMIGLSHAEREIIANVVKFNKTHFEYYGDAIKQSVIDKEEYLTMSKLTAVFRVADGICRSYKTKINDISVTIKDDEIIIKVDSDESVILERGFFRRKARFFEEVFSYKPELVHKKKVRG